MELSGFFQDTMNGPVTASSESVAVVAEHEERTPYEFPVLRRLIPGDLLPGEIALWVPLILLILYLGVKPISVTSRIDPTTGAVVTHIQRAPVAPAQAELAR